MLANRLTTMPEMPLEVRRAFREREEPVCPEQALFQEVCARATADAMGYVSEAVPRLKSKYIEDARDWFENGETADLFFDMAGIMFATVRDAVLANPPVKKFRQSRKPRTSRES